MNLLLLSVDSLRWDMVGRTHPELLATPRFDAVTQGFAFTDRCFSVSTATRPVHQSIFSGLYPFEHGITGQHRRARRRGIPRLMSRLREAGYRVHALSEAAPILGGVDIGTHVQDLPTDAIDGLRRIDALIDPRRADTTQHALFVHYWSTHAPYGAADGQALGETARLVHSGQHEEVRARYRSAVRDCFDNKIAPLIGRLDLGAWTVILFGDHGERWTAEELYHGRTLHHDVLRVPLFLHVPYRSAQPTGPICSLIDLEPTIRSLLNLEPSLGLGRDLLATPADSQRLHLAQIEPTPTGAGDDVHLLTDARSAAPRGEHHDAQQIWAVFNDRHKATIREPEGKVTWAETFDNRASPLEEPAPFDALVARDEVRGRSGFAMGELEDGIDAAALESRLRDLGYLS